MLSPSVVPVLRVALPSRTECRRSERRRVTPSVRIRRHNAIQDEQKTRDEVFVEEFTETYATDTVDKLQTKANAFASVHGLDGMCGRLVVGFRIDDG